MTRATHPLAGRLARLGMVLLLGGDLALGAGEPPLRVGVGDSPPYTYMQQGRPVGIEVELLQAMSRADPALRFVGLDQPLTIQRVIEEEKEGHIGISFSAKTPEREARYHFLEPAIEVSRIHVLGRGDETARIASLDDIAALDGRAVVLVLPGSSPYAVVSRHFGLTLDAAPISVEQMMRKLQIGRGRFAIGLETTLQYRAQKLGVSSQLRWQPAVLGELSLHFVASRHLPTVRLAELDAAWKKVALSPKLIEIIRRYAGEPIAETP